MEDHGEKERERERERERDLMGSSKVSMSATRKEKKRREDIIKRIVCHYLFHRISVFFFFFSFFLTFRT